MPESSPILGFVEAITPQGITGWAIAPDDPDPVRLTLRIDGEDGPVINCNLAREDVLHDREDVRAIPGRGPHVGFAVSLAPTIRDNRHHVLEMVAEDGSPVALYTLNGTRQSSWDVVFPSVLVQGMVEPGAPGQPIHGWAVVVQSESGETRTGVEIQVKTPERVLATLQASGYREDVARVLGCEPDCGFIYWPADELRHSARQNVHFFVLPDGLELPNSPIAIGGDIPAVPEPVPVAEQVAVPVEPAPLVEPLEGVVMAPVVPAGIDVGDAWPTLVALLVEPYYSNTAELQRGSFIESLRHFATEGLQRGLSPSPLFDPSVYATKAAKAGLPPIAPTVSPIVHWLRYGVSARIVPTELFDEDYYLAHQPKVASSGRFGFDHFICEGLAAGLRPNAWFDPVWYRISLPELAEDTPALLNFLATGRAAGLSPNPMLLAARLPAAALEAWTAFGTPLMAAIDRLVPVVGGSGIAFLLSLFQLSAYRVVAKLAADVSALEGLYHFLSQGLDLGLSPSPLFEPEFYAAEWLRLTGTPLPEEQPALLHWLTQGRRQVAVPTRLFLAAHYRNQWSDMVDPAIDVFDHFVKAGVFEDRQANPWFEPPWFKRQMGDRLRAKAPAYIAFLTFGEASLACRVIWLLAGGTSNAANDGKSPAPPAFTESFAHLVVVTKPWLETLSAEQIHLAALLFAPEIYTGDGSIDPGCTVIDKLAHFFEFEVARGLDVGPLFNAAYYRKQAASRGLHLDEAASPLVHFLQQGVAQRIVPTQLFDEQAYLLANPDLKSYPGWLFLHFIRDGLYEGRTYTTQPMIAIAPDFSLTPVEGARRKLLTRISSDIAADSVLPRGLQKTVRAQRGAVGLLASPLFGDIMARAQAIEPGVGERLELRDLLLPPLHDGIASKFQALRQRLARNSYDHVICIPWLRSGGADLVSGFLSHGLRELFPQQSILLLRTDQPHFERADWLPADIDVLDMSDVTRSVPPLEAERLLFALLRGLRPRGVYNVNSRLCWLFMRRFGKRMPSDTKLFAYLFCWDQTATGVRVGYPTDFFPDTHSCLTTLFTDTHYLKNELIRTYALPPAVSERIVAIASPSKTPEIATTMAERGVATAPARKAPLFLWGGRLDFQKRFDLLVAIARRMPDCDFRCWGTAMLDAAPDLSMLPANVTMMGSFKNLTDLPLGESDGWVFTSAWEGLPTTIIELGKLGVPIVASAVGGIPEIIDASTGWLVEPFDSVDGFIDALRDMLEQPQERIRRGRHLQERVRGRHTMDAYKATLAQAIVPEPV